MRAGSFKGNYHFNVKRQMEMREFAECKGEKKENVTVALVGGGQTGRLAREMENGTGLGWWEW